MPKYFGEDNPEIPDMVLANIISYVDNRTLTLILPQVSRNWRLITKSKQFHENILKSILKRINFFSFDNLEGKVEIIPSGHTNTNYKIVKDEEYYVLRVPIMKNHLFINRACEQYNTVIAHKLGLGAKLIFYEISTGIMVTKYIKNKNYLTKENLCDENTLRMISHQLKILHKSPDQFIGDWIIFNKIRELYHFIIENCLFNDSKILESLMNQVDLISKSFEKLDIKLSPCHNDLSPNNFLSVNNEVEIIDWEFSGNNDPVWDLSFLSIVSELSLQDEDFLLSQYFDGKPGEIDHVRFLLYKPIAHFWIGLLSLLQIYNCNERLGKAWLTQVAESKFNKAKGLFECTQELINQLDRNKVNVGTDDKIEPSPILKFESTNNRGCFSWLPFFSCCRGNSVTPLLNRGVEDRDRVQERTTLWKCF